MSALLTNHPNVEIGGFQDSGLSSLVYLRNRFLWPTIARFLNRDPISFEGDGPNLYWYSANNPVVNIDPSGNIYLTGINRLGPLWNEKRRHRRRQ